MFNILYDKLKNELLEKEAKLKNEYENKS